jgi:hypothetical protein
VPAESSVRAVDSNRIERRINISPSISGLPAYRSAPLF